MKLYDTVSMDTNASEEFRMSKFEARLLNFIQVTSDVLAGVALVAFLTVAAYSTLTQILPSLF